MFTTKSKEEGIKKLSTLLTKEKLVMISCEQKISIKKDEEVEKILKDAPPQDIFKFCEKSPPIKRFCQKPGIHTQAWSERLKIVGYTGTDIKSVDATETCWIANQYMASFLLKNVNMTSEEKSASPLLDPILSAACLDKACELGEFNALVKRIEINSKNIVLRIDHTKPQFDKDIERLCNLYWSMGYAHASLLFLSLANTFFNKNTVNDISTGTFNQEEEAAAILYKNTVDNISIGTFYQEEAAMKFFSARLLLSPKASSSSEIIQAISKNEGLKIMGFNTWDEAKDKIFTGINSDRINYLFDCAKLKIQAMLKVAETGADKVIQQGPR